MGSILVSASEFDDFTRPTVVRIRGHLIVEAFAIDTTFAIVTSGITIINPDEPVPNPFDQRRGNRWLWWDCRYLQSSPSGATNTFVDGVSRYTVPFDIRAMRKRLVDGSQLQLAVLNDVASTANINVWVAASSLVKE